jgi:anti-sigma factor ChrR (cupin superfamily)
MHFGACETTTRWPAAAIGHVAQPKCVMLATGAADRRATDETAMCSPNTDGAFALRSCNHGNWISLDLWDGTGVRLFDIQMFF